MQLYLHLAETDAGVFAEKWSFDATRAFRKNGEWIESVVNDPVSFDAPDEAELVPFGGFVKLSFRGKLLTAGEVYEMAWEGRDGFLLSPVRKKSRHLTRKQSVVQ